MRIVRVCMVPSPPMLIGETVQWSEPWCDAMNDLDPRVHDDEFMCQWAAPYGFVPEAGCPKHDA